MEEHASIERRVAHIKLLLMDCDGVLTDGGLILRENGDEQKTFNARDGLGLVLWHRAGLRSGIISGRRSVVVERRAQELGIEFVRQGCIEKIKDFEEVLSEAQLTESEVAYIGDDVTDVPVLRRSGLALAVADAAEETRAASHYVTKLPGGRGAVREAIEVILKAQGRWHELMKRYEQ